MRTLIIFLILSCSLISGCIGIDIVHPDTIDLPKTDTKSVTALGEGKVIQRPGYQWAGIVITPIIPIPIPLAVPVGRKKNVVWVDDQGAELKYQINTTQVNGFACMWLVFCQTNVTLGKLIFSSPDFR